MTGASPGYSPPTACKCTVSGTISLPSQGFFSPFPHGTGSLSVAKEYLGLRGGPRRFTRICSVSALLGIQTGDRVRFGYGAITHCGRPFLNRSPTQQFCNFVVRLVSYVFVPRPHVCNATRLVHRHGLASTLFARRYSGCRGCFPFLGVLRCFNSPGSLSRPYVFRPEYHSMTSGGFPHSDIHGSMPSRRLPVAFRSHSRPSSVLGAKASTVGSS